MVSKKVWVYFIPYAAVSMLHVWFLATHNPLSAPTKLLLMPLLAFAVILSLWVTKNKQALTFVLLVFGILASWLGDGSGTFFPMFESALPMMLLWFGVAHLAYMYIFWRTLGSASINTDGKPRFLHPATYFYLVAFIVLLALIAPKAGSLTIPVIFYAIVLTGTAMLATRVSSIVAWGGFWFLVSDSILGLRIFLPDTMPDWTSAAVMLTYTLGQGLIGYGAVRKIRQQTVVSKSNESNAPQIATQ